MPGPYEKKHGLQHVYDSTVLAWVRMAQPAVSGAAGSTQVSVSTGSVRVHQSTAADLRAEVVPRRASTVARSSVTQSSTTGAVSAASSGRVQWTCANASDTGAAVLYLKFGATASTSDYDVRLVRFAYYEMPAPIYTGQIDGIWKSTGVGFARICEWRD